MNCRKVRRFLYGYCKNELTLEESKKIKAHLDDCAECAREMGKVAEICNVLADSLEVLVPSPDFNEKLLAKIPALPREVEGRIKQTWWQKLLHETFPSVRLRWVAAGAVSVIVLALVATMVTRERFSQGPESMVSDGIHAEGQDLASSGKKGDSSLEGIFDQTGRTPTLNDKSFVIENLTTAALDKAFDSTQRGEDGRITPVDLHRRFVIERSLNQGVSRGNHYILPVVSAQPASRKTDY